MIAIVSLSCGERSHRIASHPQSQTSDGEKTTHRMESKLPRGQA